MPEMREVDPSEVLEQEQPSVLEVSLQEFDNMVRIKKALDRLTDNEDYKLIIDSMYLEEDYLRLAGFLKSNNAQAIKDRPRIVEKIVAKGVLSTYIRDLQQGLSGIDNPEQRLELIRQIEEDMANGPQGEADE